jgi:hypothetical protein
MKKHGGTTQKNRETMTENGSSTREIRHGRDNMQKNGMTGTAGIMTTAIQASVNFWQGLCWD